MKSLTVEKIRGIYAITADSPINIDQIKKIIIQHNVSILQYRNKRNPPYNTINRDLKLIEATQLRQLCLQYHTLFIINDDINLAQKVGADGVHLGKNDGSIKTARKQLGDKSIIGVSCYNDINLAKIAQKQGADYVAFGALFASNTKPNAIYCPLDIITQASKIIDIPIVGIGGIDFNNQQQVFDAGGDAVAMIGALFETSK